MKNLEDGSRAVGPFNLGTAPATIRIDGTALGLMDSLLVRELWRKKDVGLFDNGFEGLVRPHGVTLVRVRRARA